MKDDELEGPCRGQWSGGREIGWNTRETGGRTGLLGGARRYMGGNTLRPIRIKREKCGDRLRHTTDTGNCLRTPGAE